jgi:serine/threonine protein kinase/tetratricopeptide (TPR) repeat protein
MSTTAPTRLGPYRIVGRIGEGGMGVVYRAEHVDTGEPVAVKTARSPYASQMSGLRCEIHALTRIRHPGIVRIIAEGAEQGLPWYAMELLEGKTLEDYLRQVWTAVPMGAHVTIGRAETLPGDTPPPIPAGPRTPLPPAPALPPAAAGLPPPPANPFSSPSESRPPPGSGLRAAPVGSGPLRMPTVPASAPNSPRRLAGAGRLEDVLKVFKRLCAPLSFLHASGIVHRDLKPANVFLKGDGTPVLMDFGLVVRAESVTGRERIEVAGDVLGTAAYMSPEQVKGQLVDPRTDLYALGCMLYEAVTGRVPFPGNNLSEVMWMHLQREAEPPSLLAEGVPAQLDQLITRLLAKDPQQRLGHADDVAQAIDLLLDDGGATPVPDRRGGYLYRPRMAGRDELMGRLRQRIELLRQGQGGQLLLGGESGVGKTTLASAAAHHARQKRVPIITGECLQLGAAPDGSGDVQGAPLHPFKGFFDAVADRCREQGEELTERWLGARGRVLAAVAPVLAGLPGQEKHAEPPEVPAQAARARLVEALRDTLAAVAGERGLMLVLDDLQWADELTISTLAALDADWLAGRRLMVLGTYRSEEMNDALRELLKTPGVEDLPVGRLDRATVGTIVADMLAMREPPPALVGLLATRSDGNPFFVAEYLRTAVAEGLLFRAYGSWQAAGSADGHFEALDLPDSLRDLVARRLGGLSAGARGLAEAAAVLGREMDGDLAVLVVGAAQDDALTALKELLAKQVLVEVRSGRFRFIHDKLREITYDRIDAARRRELHRRAGESLEARQAGGSVPLAFHELAHHFAEAGEPADLSKAMGYLELAGEQARKNFTNREAVRLYTDLLGIETRLPERVPPLSRARWHRLLADAYLGLGKTVESQTHLLEAVKLLGHPMPEGKVRLPLGLVGQALTQLGHRLRPMSGEADAVRREHLLEAARAYDLLMPVSYYVTGDIRRILYATLANVNLAERAGPSPELALAYGNMHVTTGLIPMAGVAESYWKRTQDVLEGVSDPAVRSWICILAGAYAVGTGDWARARALGEEALRIARSVGFHRRGEEAMGLLGNVHVLRGEFAEALEVSRSARQSGLRGDPQTQLWGHSGEAQALLHMGRVDEARAAADRAQALFDEVSSRPERIMALGAVAAARLASGDVEAARAAASEALGEMAKGTPTSFYCIVAYSSVAETFLRLWIDARGNGHTAEAEKQLLRGLEEVKRSSKVFPVHRPRWLLLQARRAAALGQTGKARRLARKSREAAEALEMKHDVGLAERLLRELGEGGEAGRQLGSGG